MDSRQRTSSPVQLTRVDPAPALRALLKDMDEVSEQAGFLNDQASLERCRALAAKARKATLTYRAIIEDIHQNLLAIYGSRPEEFSDMLDARVADLVARGFPNEPDQGYKDNVVHLTNEMRAG